MIKLIVMDLDGTLLPYGQTSLSDRTRLLIHGLREKGKIVVFSSGRTYGELTSYLSEWKQDAFLPVVTVLIPYIRIKKYMKEKLSWRIWFVSSAKIWRTVFLYYTAQGEIFWWER